MLRLCRSRGVASIGTEKTTFAYGGDTAQGARQKVDYEKIFLRPLVGLLKDQPTDVIERLTVEALTKHRYLVSEAELAYDRFKKSHDDLEISDAQERYFSAMIAVHAQQTVVSTMLEILGYIPPTQAEKPH